MRLAAAMLALGLLAAGCGDGVETLRLVTVSAPKSTAFALRELPASTLRHLGLPYGLAVIKAGGAAERSGLRIGDVVYGVEQRRFRSLEDFYRLVAERKHGPLALLVRRGNSDLYLSIEFGSPDPLRPRDTLLRT